MVGSVHRHESAPGQRGVSAAAKPRGAVTGLARDSGRRAPASVHAWTEGVCRPLPHLTGPLLDSPATVGGAHRQASMPGWRRGAGHRHTTRRHSRTQPRWWEARTGKRWGRGAPIAATPRGAVPRLTRDGRRRPPTNVNAWTEGVGGATTPRGAVPGLSRDGGSYAPTPPTCCHHGHRNGRRRRSAQIALCPPHNWNWQRRPLTAGSRPESSTVGRASTVTQSHRRQAHGQTACTAPLLIPCTRTQARCPTTACHALLLGHPRSV
jgi:hypothetical protein